MNQDLEQGVGVRTPLVVVNFKTYLEATGLNALNVAKIMEEVTAETGVLMVPAVQLSDLRMVAESVTIPVFAQHVDGVDPGSNTGKVLAEAVVEAGGVGTLLNHSENRLSRDEIEKSIKACDRVNLTTILCAETADEGADLDSLNPDFIAVEPPELIGGDISVTTANPSLISESVSKIGEGRVLVGAGVKTGEDVKAGKDLGAVGVLVASGVCKAEDVKSVLMDFAQNLL